VIKLFDLVSQRVDFFVGQGTLEMIGQRAGQGDGHRRARTQSGSDRDRGSDFDLEIGKRGNARALENALDHGSQGMVGGERIQLGVQVHRGRLDPDPAARRVRDLHIHVDLRHGHSQRRPPVDDSMFAEQNDLTGSRRSGHKG
jgi:hypothetical protein